MAPRKPGKNPKRKKAPGRRPRQLDPKERKERIIQELCLGLAVCDIARKFDVAENTVYVYKREPEVAARIDAARKAKAEAWQRKQDDFIEQMTDDWMTMNRIVSHRLKTSIETILRDNPEAWYEFEQELEEAGFYMDRETGLQIPKTRSRKVKKRQYSIPELLDVYKIVSKPFFNQKVSEK